MYSKIYEQMFDGTLATHGPWQALVTFQQMLILADPTGVVDMTAEALSRRTTIPLEIIKIGIAALERPDPESRLPADEGRRIVRLDDHRTWGWRITNFIHYRNLRSNDERREYQRILMRDRRAEEKAERERAGSVSTALAPVSNVSPRSTQYADTRKPLADPAGFGQFWTIWPKRVKKVEAEKAWAKINPDEALLVTILEGVKRWAASEEWTKDGGKYTPHPATWLNGRRWEDELVVVAKPRMVL